MPGKNIPASKDVGSLMTIFYSKFGLEMFQIADPALTNSNTAVQMMTKLHVDIMRAVSKRK